MESQLILTKTTELTRLLMLLYTLILPAYGRLFRSNRNRLKLTAIVTDCQIGRTEIIKNG